MKNKQNLNKPNVVFILVDQLRACSLPQYGQTGIDLPNIAALQESGITFNNCVSSYPLCTPYRSMLMTGRYPQSTGMFLNFSCIRHDEIGMGDVFKNAGYKTGYVGKWHLHRGSFPSHALGDWIPEGRSRLGFDYWRAYSCHTEYFNGRISTEDWQTEQWKGYETEGLLDYTFDFIHQCGDHPFLCVLSPHQPHGCWQDPHAPKDCYDRLPNYLSLPGNVNEVTAKMIEHHYRDYMAMIIAIDDMIGNVVNHLKSKDLYDNTLLVLTSDHGSLFGAHHDEPEINQWAPWGKNRAVEESIHVPMFIKMPGNEKAGEYSDILISPVDIMPTLCSLAGLTPPQTVEGMDLSAGITDEGGGEVAEREAAYLMNFLNYETSPDYFPVDGNEWRGVRTKRFTFVKWRDGKEELYDLLKDPLQNKNVIGRDDYAAEEEMMRGYLRSFMESLKDDIHPSSYYRDWLDNERRVIKNAFGSLPHPENLPDMEYAFGVEPLNRHN